MDTDLAPLVIFAYKRKNELQQVVASLQQCTLAQQTDLFLFSDGPKREKDIDDVFEVREFIKTIGGFKSVTYSFSEVNKGLANSIIFGVSKMFETFETVIVLEDDLIVSKNFLQYMNQSLQFYKDIKKVFSISGYCYDFEIKKDQTNDVYFLPRPCSIGWATWKDRWVDLDWDITDFEDFSRDKKSIRGFKDGGSDIYNMLKKQQEGEIDSWAIRWSYNQFKKQSLTAYPILSKIKNIGFSEKATNTNVIFNKYATAFDLEGKERYDFPYKVELDPFYHNQLLNFYSIQSRIKNRLLTYLVRMGLIQNKA